MYIDCLVYFSFFTFRYTIIYVEFCNEICTCNEKAGSPGGFKCVPIKSGELRLKCFDSDLRMTKEIFYAIKRI